MSDKGHGFGRRSGNGSGDIKGKRIVLCASDSESSEYLKSTWRQMLLATLPARYARAMGTDISFRNETWPDGQAKYVPHGLRIIESLLLTKFDASDVVVTYPAQMHQFIGSQTRVVGIHAHNPLGITFATDIYAHFYGATEDPVTAPSPPWCATRGCSTSFPRSPSARASVSTQTPPTPITATPISSLA
ncbi:MAG: hypothetical protein ACRD6I_07940 [Candidatus Acidiferrales bacterium]